VEDSVKSGDTGDVKNGGEGWLENEGVADGMEGGVNGDIGVGVNDGVEGGEEGGVKGIANVGDDSGNE